MISFYLTTSGDLLERVHFCLSYARLAQSKSINKQQKHLVRKIVWHGFSVKKILWSFWSAKQDKNLDWISKMVYVCFGNYGVAYNFSVEEFGVDTEMHLRFREYLFRHMLCLPANMYCDKDRTIEWLNYGFTVHMINTRLIWKLFNGYTVRWHAHHFRVLSFVVFDLHQIDESSICLTFD